MSARFVQGQVSQSGAYSGTRENKHISQRDKLEEAILNLATALGIVEVNRVSAQSGLIYGIGNDRYQSASNMLLTLSRRLRDQIASPP